MMLRRPILARYTKRDLDILRWMRDGAWLRMPGATSTMHPLVDVHGLTVCHVQTRVVQRLVDTRRIVWREDLLAYVITATGMDLLQRVARRAG